ncbi:MAG: nucleotidyltransferase family protein [Patescibacteria group bacterium]|nr:nucleotidyltransferase family protein [Patescibacteria group bacterium]MDE2438594.1 nucleotidyltransferase family protein [Patescibacteria group bacterium]
MWYEQEYGRPIEQYASAEDAISTWPTTATAIGVRREGVRHNVCAPFGVEDSLKMIVRPNNPKTTIEQVYRNKSTRWKAIWPRLTVIPWDEAVTLF